MKIFEMRQLHTAAVARADGLLAAAEGDNRPLTASESMAVDAAMQEASGLASRITAAEKINTIRLIQDADGRILPGSGSIRDREPEAFGQPAKRTLSPDYRSAFFDYIRSNGQNKANAALYEGAGPSGGFIVPSMVDQQIVPLAPTDMGVRTIASVVATTQDIKIPTQTTISTAAAKAESGAVTNTFAESDPVLGQFTLSAYMAGLTHTISWELAQDVPSFQQFAIGDMLLAQSLFEENWYVNGTGVGQPQGLIGNVGAGVTGVSASSEGDTTLGNAILDATYDVQGVLKGAYHEGASFLMQRSTGVLLRKAQKQANLFEPVFTRVGKTDYLHGYPVAYSTAMPAAVAGGNTPILFGNFTIGYVIGDRGGSGINVKILDQPLATAGQIILLAYRRTDGRVRRSEAIQAVTLT